MHTETANIKLFIDHFEKMVFCPYLRKYAILGISNFSLAPFEKIVFCQYVQIYQHFEEMEVI